LHAETHPRIGLFTGARFAEILALKATDVIELDGVKVFSFSPNDLRKLKTKGSQRIVPVHPALKEIGFFEHLASVPKDGLLFPDAAGPKNMIGARNKEIGKAIRALIKDDTIVFHSLRHTFKDAASRARIPRDQIALLGGWDLPGGRAAIDDYGQDRLAQILADEIAKVAFKDLELCPIEGDHGRAEAP
jgi:integrase